jgi:hypothetical protein
MKAPMRKRAAVVEPTGSHAATRTAAAFSGHRPQGEVMQRTAAFIHASPRMAAQRTRCAQAFGPVPGRATGRVPMPLPAAKDGVVQRGVGDSKLAVEDSEEPADLSEAQAEYESAVLEGINLLSGNIRFGASPESGFDKEYWEKVEDPTFRLALKVKSGKSVEEALLAIFKTPEKWSFDCAEFRQVVHLYAYYKLYGDEAFKKEAKKLGEFRLTQQTTPVVSAPQGSDPMAWASNGKGTGKLTLLVAGYDTKQTIAEGDLLDALPIGAMVCFKNEIAADTPFRNENAIKTGNDQFAAHPIGKGKSRQDIIDYLKKYNLQYKGQDGADGIYVSQAYIPASMPLGKATVQRLNTSTEGPVLKYLATKYAFDQEN